MHVAAALYCHDDVDIAAAAAAAAAATVMMYCVVNFIIGGLYWHVIDVWPTGMNVTHYRYIQYQPRKCPRHLHSSLPCTFHIGISLMLSAKRRSISMLLSQQLSMHLFSVFHVCNMKKI